MDGSHHDFAWTGITDERKIGALILAGGKSKRMGREKSKLPFGNSDFLDRILSQLCDFDELLLSVGAEGDAVPQGLVAVSDVFPQCGPIGGLHAGLCACNSAYLLAVACDMPLLERGVMQYLSAFVCEGYDAFILVDRSGRIHPLCGIYAKSAAMLLQQQIQTGEYRLSAALDNMRVKYISLRHSAYSDKVLSNINTPQEYAALSRQSIHPPIVAVSGVKNSGKTTFLAHILPLLHKEGLRVAVIKHDGHDFEPDVPGTDSFLLRQAGAQAVAVYSEGQYMLTERRQTTVEQLAEHFCGMDLILLEGGKYTPYPKIELARAAVSNNFVCNPATLLAVCTDLGYAPDGISLLALDNYAGAVRLLLRFLNSNLM